MRKRIGLVVSLFIIFSIFNVSSYGFGGKAKEDKYPTKPISVIVPWSPGGGTDMVARAAAKELAGNLGIGINVINKSGGKGIPGTVEALNSSADGYTLLADADGSNAIPAAWGSDVPFDVAGRTYIAKVGEFPWIFAIRADSDWKSLNDVAEAIRTKPENIKWGWLGGTAGADAPVAQFRAALVKKGINVSKIKMVTYSGGSELATAVAGGHVDIGVVSTTSIAPVYKAGKVKLIAVTSKDRFPIYQDVSTTLEQGWKTVNFSGHVGYVGPKGLSSKIVGKLEEGLKEVVSSPEYKKELDKIGATPAFLGSKDYRNYVLKLTKELKGLNK